MCAVLLYLQGLPLTAEELLQVVIFDICLAVFPVLQFVDVLGHLVVQPCDGLLGEVVLLVYGLTEVGNDLAVLHRLWSCLSAAPSLCLCLSARCDEHKGEEG